MSVVLSDGLSNGLSSNCTVCGMPSLVLCAGRMACWVRRRVITEYHWTLFHSFFASFESSSSFFNVHSTHAVGEYKHHALTAVRHGHL
jgi:hypothetical protein